MLRLLSVVVALLALVFYPQAPHFPREFLRFFNDESPDITLRNPVLFAAPPTCPKPEKQSTSNTFYTDTERSMALADQAKRVAAEFDFGPDNVRKAVKEFIREMGTF